MDNIYCTIYNKNTADTSATNQQKKLMLRLKNAHFWNIYTAVISHNKYIKFHIIHNKYRKYKYRRIQLIWINYYNVRSRLSSVEYYCSLYYPLASLMLQLVLKKEIKEMCSSWSVKLFPYTDFKTNFLSLCFFKQFKSSSPIKYLA